MLASAAACAHPQLNSCIHSEQSRRRTQLHPKHIHAQISNAYEVLSDDQKKSLYDRCTCSPPHRHLTVQDNACHVFIS